MISTDKRDIIRFDKNSESFGSIFFENEELITKGSARCFDIKLVEK